MKLETRTLAQFVESMSATVQGTATRLVDLSVGSVLRAVLEASASVALWLQWLISDVLNASRAATSEGENLDSWMADFSFTRLPASRAVGSVTFGRYADIGAVMIPVGARVRTADGGTTVAVVADRDHPLWWEPATGYRLPDGQLTATVPVASETAGNMMNVQASTLTLIASPLPGIDTVTNDAPLTGGADAESDSVFRNRFLEYINSRSLATVGAVRTAIAGIRQGLDFVVHEGIDADGQPAAGHFVVTVDDGTGSPSTALMDEISAAVELVRPVGTSFSIVAPNVVNVDVSLHLTLATDSATPLGSIHAAVTDAVTRYVNRLSIGEALSMTRLAQIAYAVSAEIRNVSAVTINGSGDDLIPRDREAIKANHVNVY